MMRFIVFHIVLFEPEIPPNTGNVIRVCANTGAQLHLIKPLGFAPTDTKLKRAGLDYHDWAKIEIHENFAAFLEKTQPKRLFVCETVGNQIYTEPSYQQGDVFYLARKQEGSRKLF